MGDQQNKRAYPNDTFRKMQGRLNEGYGRIARELKVPVAPVGPAWQEALTRRPGLELWVGDGSHPTLTGSYLEVCVFFKALYGKQAKLVGNAYTAGLDPGLAGFLQEVAEAVSRSWKG